jgi:hypothetical protein
LHDQNVIENKNLKNDILLNVRELVKKWSYDVYIIINIRLTVFKKLYYLVKFKIIFLLLNFKVED